MKRRPRVILADDHTLVTEALVGLLQPRFEIVATVADGAALVRTVQERKPDVVVVDIAMPMVNGLDAARQIRQTVPECKLIFLTMANDAALAAEAFRMGATGFLLKTSAGWELLKAIDAALQGRRYVTPSIRHALADPPGDGRGRALHAELTPRQREVLQLLARGGAMKQVAAALGLTTRTVAFHKYQIMSKFQLESSAELIQFAIRQGLIGPGEISSNRERGYPGGASRPRA
jgi:DNA-binding NarL/FixJ family response regulator